MNAKLYTVLIGASFLMSQMKINVYVFSAVKMVVRRKRHSSSNDYIINGIKTVQWYRDEESINPSCRIRESFTINLIFECHIKKERKDFISMTWWGWHIFAKRNSKNKCVTGWNFMMYLGNHESACVIE